MTKPQCSCKPEAAKLDLCRYWISVLPEAERQSRASVRWVGEPKTDSYNVTKMMRLAVQTKIANGTKRAKETVSAGIRDNTDGLLRSEAVRTRWKWTATAKQMIVHSNTVTRDRSAGHAKPLHVESSQ